MVLVSRFNVIINKTQNNIIKYEELGDYLACTTVRLIRNEAVSYIYISRRLYDKAGNPVYVNDNICTESRKST